LEKELSRLVPVRRLRFSRARVAELVRTDGGSGSWDVQGAQYERRDYTTEQLLFDTRGADSVPASSASEGTLIATGLLAALYGPDRPRVILLDDVGRGLHPRAQLELVSILRSLLESDPTLQLIATTHSPYVLDKLSPDEVRLVVQRDDGSSVCGRLQDHPEFEQWKEEMTPGEFWMMFGEKWLADGRQPALATSEG
jgi:predicted ATPase